MQRQRIAQILLTIALVIVFGWFGIDKLIEPLLWRGFMPSWMDGLFGFPIDTWLVVVGVSEMALAILLLIPIRKVRLVGAALVALHLLVIITQLFVDAGWNDLVVRDIGLFFASVALLLLL